MRGKYEGGSYVAAEQQLYEDALTQGVVPSRGAVLPKLSNGQIVALVYAWRIHRALKSESIEQDAPPPGKKPWYLRPLLGAAIKLKAPPWPEEWDLTLEALGYRQSGDRFRTDADWIKAEAEPELLELFWAAVKHRAAELDAFGLKFAPIVVDWSAEFYKKQAGQAWARLQSERGVGPKAAPTVSTAKNESSGSGAGLIILIALVIAAGKSRKRR